MTPDEAARLFADSLSTVDNIIRKLAWRTGVSSERADEFRTWAIQRLVNDSYELVRRFGVVEFSTYLSVTLSTWFREFFGQSSSAVGDELHATRNRIDESLTARPRDPPAEAEASPLGALVAQVVCVGAVVGTARFDATEGLAYARFSPAPDYEMIAVAARAVGGWVPRTLFWPSDSGDFANALAAQWSAPKLSLVDAFGRDVAANSVIVIDAVHPSGRHLGRWVVADFRADGARVPARLRAPDGSDHDAKDANARPAA